MFPGNVNHARPFLAKPACNTPSWARDTITSIHPGWTSVSQHGQAWLQLAQKKKVLWKTVVWNVTFSELFQARSTLKGRAGGQEKVKNNWLLLHFLPQNSIYVRYVCQGSGKSNLHHPPLEIVRLCYGYTKVVQSLQEGPALELQRRSW